VAGVGRAAALTRPLLRPLPRLHRDSLGWAAIPELAEKSGASSSAMTVASLTSSALAVDAPLALREGAPLPVRAGEPDTLGAALRAAPAQARIVYVSPDGSERTESYGSQLTQAERVLGGLRALGVEPGARVLFQLERAEDVVPLFWACMLGGFEAVIAPVPVAYGAPSRALTQLGELLALFERVTLVCPRARVEELRAGLGDALARVRLAQIEQLREAQPDGRQHAASATDVALYALSSGSTAGSKAIALTHRNLLARARGVNAHCYGAADVVLNWLPFDHIGSISEGHLRPLLLGCQLVYAAKEYIVGRPLRLLELIDSHRISHTWAPNFSYALVTAALAREPSAAWDLSCVSMLLNAGELITVSAVEQFVSALKPFGLRRSAVQSAFGMAELCSGVTYHQPAAGEALRFYHVDRASLGAALRAVEPGDPAAIAFASLGTVIPGVAMRIVDGAGQVLRERECGRLQFKGEALSPGYFNNAGANRAFGADGWFDTGDGGFIADGELVLTGRADAGIIVNGANFSNAEIEAVVEEVDGVVTSYVAACAVRARDGAGTRLALFFQPEAFEPALGRLLTAIQARLAQRLGIKADYLLPVSGAAIPKTEIGKIQRKKLTEQFERGEYADQVRQMELLQGGRATFGAAHFRRLWRPRQLAHASRARSGVALLLVGASGVEESLARELRRREQPWLALLAGERFGEQEPSLLQLRLDDEQDLLALARWLERSKLQVHSVVDLRGVEAHGTASLAELVRALHPRGQPREGLRLLAVCREVESREVQSSENSAERSAGRGRAVGAASLLAAAAREVPWLRTILVDVSDPELSAEARAAAIVAELTGASAEDVVAYRSGVRWAECIEPIDVSGQLRSGPLLSALPFVRGQTVVVAGLGTRLEASSLEASSLETSSLETLSLEVRLLEALIDRYGVRVLLLEEPGAARDVLAEPLRRWQEQGAFRTVTLDVGDVESVSAALASACADPNAAPCCLLHISREAAAEPGTERSGRELSALLERRARALGCFAEVARTHEGASLCALSVLPDGSVPAFRWQNQRWLAVATAARPCAIELRQQDAADGDIIDALLVALRCGGDVIVEMGAAPSTALRSGRIVGAELELCQTQLFLAVRDRAAWERCCALELHDRHGNPSRVQLVPLRWGAARADGADGSADSEASGLLRHLPELPLDPSGGIDRVRLAALAAAGATPTTALPASALESQIAAIWREILNVERVNPDDNFFELGGHSLLLVQAHERLSRSGLTRGGAALTLVDLFKYPTVQALARFLGEGQPRETAAARGAVRAQARRQRHDSPSDSVAIVGMACRFPGATDLDTFWQNLALGVESIATLSLEELLAAGVDRALATHPDYVRASPRLEDIAGFDADFFGYGAREAELMDPQHRLLLECAWEAFEVAGHDPLVHDGPVGVYVGAALNTYLVNHLLPSRATLDPSDDLSVLTLDSMGGFQLMVAADKDYLPTRISYKLNLTGPSINVQTACSTGLVAIHLACQAILAGECDSALAGGASIQAPDATGHLYREGMIVSPDGHCRAFDRNARGTIFGSGVGMVLLKRLDHALRDRDPIWGVVKGTAVNNDGGLKVGYMAPAGDGQAAVVAEALAVAQVEPESVTFVEAHGTGTELGDPIEIAGLTEAFRVGTERRQYCAVGSVKTNIGHMQITSGVAGFIKATLALERALIPPTLHYQSPNPAIDFASSPFFVNTQPLAWQPQGKRRAGVNSLGIGGTNAHAILEEAPPLPALEPSPARALHALTLSAKRSEGLTALVSRYCDWLDRGVQPELADLCYTSNVGRSHFEHRLAVCADSLAGLRQELDVAASQRRDRETASQRRDGETASQRRDGAATVERGRARPKLLFLFTGQGSQWPGMGRRLFESQPVFRSALERCAALLRGRLEPDLLSVIHPSAGAESPLDRTEWTQPALFAFEYALYEMWRSFGVEPDLVSGHSIGEYVAAYAAGVFSLEDALLIVTERGRLMSQQPGPGAMAAVFASEQVLAPRLARHAERLSIAALNGPSHTVVSGERAALEELLAELVADGIQYKLLRVSHGFHSPLMRGAAAPFERFLARFELRPPRLPLLSNVSGRVAEAELCEPSYWARQLCAPVRFAEGIEVARRAGCELLLELGPRPSLLGLADALLGGTGVQLLPSLRPGRDDDWVPLTQSLARLYEAGVAIDWKAVHRGADRRRVVLPTYAFQRQRCWVDPPSAARSERAPRAVAASEAGLLVAQPLSPLIPQRLWQAELSSRSAPFLADHRVFDRTVVSGACYVALVLDVGLRQLGAAACELRDVVFERALHIPDGASVRVQLVLEPLPAEASEVPATERSRSNGAAPPPPQLERFAFRFISIPAGARPDAFVQHAEGVLALLARPSSVKPVELESLLARCPESLEVEAFYAEQSSRRIELGHSYRWLSALRRGQREAMAEMVAPSEVERGFSGPWHPGVIDACFGLLLSCEAPSSATQVPFRIARVRAQAAPSSDVRGGASRGLLHGHALCAPEPLAAGDGARGDMRLLDSAGRPVLEIERLEARQVQRGAFIAAQRSAPDEVFYQLAWQPAPAESAARAALPRGSFVLLGGESATAEGLARRIRAQGQRCYRVVSAAGAAGEDIWTVAPGDIEGLRRCLERAEPAIAGLVQLEDGAGEVQPDAGDLLGLRSAHERSCGRLLELVQALQRTGWRRLPSLWLVTRGAQSLDAAPLDLGRAPLWGFARALAVEQPDLACARIDLDPAGPADASEQLLQELTRGPSSDEVAWRGGQRRLQRLIRAVPRAGAAPALDPHGSYLVTGGLGALGRRIAAWLVDKGARHVVLVGRHLPELPLPELESLRERGCTLQLLSADISEPGAVAALVAQLSAEGRALRGVLHLAGALDDGVLAQQSWARFRRVMAGKVDGAINLHHATRELELDFFICFSSIASVLGAPAQANYAAANAFLDALCQQRRADGRPGLSLNWGPWSGTGMAASVQARDRERIERQGILSLAPDEALAALDAAWADPAPQRLVAHMDWAAFQRAAHESNLPPLLEGFATRHTIPPRRAYLRVELEATAPPLRRRELLRLVRVEV
ncbi:MAG: hypothetical protein RL033_3917, partial [Pseudomonadota bacterium]